MTSLILSFSEIKMLFFENKNTLRFRFPLPNFIFLITLIVKYVVIISSPLYDVERITRLDFGFYPILPVYIRMLRGIEKKINMKILPLSHIKKINLFIKNRVIRTSPFKSLFLPICQKKVRTE